MSDKPLLGTVRASSWPALFDCAMRWQYQNIMGLRLPSSGAACTGHGLHRGTAVYDNQRLAGEAPKIEAAYSALVDTIYKPEGDVVWEHDFGQEKAERIGIALLDNYAATIAPTHEFRAVEVKCEALDVTTDSGIIRLTGTADRVRVTEAGEGISDIKSGATAVNAAGEVKTKGHHMQTGIYRIMAEATLQRRLEAPDELIGMQTNGKARVAFAELRDSRTALVGDHDTPGMIEIAAKMLKAGSFPPNPSSVLCSPKYCPGYQRCKFHD